MNTASSDWKLPELKGSPVAVRRRRFLRGWLLAGLGSLRGIAADPTGGVVAWGNEGFGPPVVPEAARSNVVAIAAGTAHLLALRPDGTVLEWGIHESEASTVPGVRTAVAVAAGRAHSAALLADGTVAVWGGDAFGQLRVPAGLSNVVAVAAAGDHTVALQSDGQVVAWGDSMAVLPVPDIAMPAKAVAAGDLMIQARRADGSLIPWSLEGEPILLPSALGTVKHSGVGRFHQAAVDSEGRLVVWTNERDEVWRLTEDHTVSSLAIRGERLLALRQNGTVISFGLRFWPDPPFEELPVPLGLSRVFSVASSGTYSMALVAEAPPIILREPQDQIAPEFTRMQLTVLVEDAAARFQWRRNGQSVPGATEATLEIPVAWVGVHDGLYDVQVRIGAQEVTSRSAQVTLTPAPPSNLVVWSVGLSEDPVPLGARSQVRTVALGGFGGVVLHHDGRVTSWPDLAPEELGPVEAVAAGFHHRVAVERTGRVVVWGQTRQGQGQVPEGLAEVVAVSAGAFHTLALRRSGEMVAWGDNAAGQCDVPPGLDRVMAVAAGYRHSVALQDDGSLVQWGDNGFPASQTPKDLGRVRAVAAGGFHTVALLEDGTVRAWGANGRQQTEVPLGLSGVVQVAAGADTTVALHADGRVTGWGAGWVSAVPPGVWGVTDIAAGADFAVALIGTPRLELRSADAGFQLEWLSRGEPLVLQQRGPWGDGTWENVPLPIPTPAAGGRVVVPLNLDGVNRSYRLRRPVPQAPSQSP